MSCDDTPQPNMQGLSDVTKAGIQNVIEKAKEFFLKIAPELDADVATPLGSFIVRKQNRDHVTDQEVAIVAGTLHTALSAMNEDGPTIVMVETTYHRITAAFYTVNV